MVSADNIRDDMPVICSKGGKFADVDHMQDGKIKLKKDAEGKHHYMPLEMVTEVRDGQVHVDRPGDQALQACGTAP